MSSAPHNLHSIEPDRDKALELSVSVVIPVYNRSDLLERTLDALAHQGPETPPYDVHIGDDGSEEDIRSVVADASGLTAFYHRRDRDHFGAGQARNLAARHATGDILVFLDSDCLVGPDFVLDHASWHTTGDDTVVIGGRMHAVMGSADDLADYRKRLRRRTAGLQHGSEIFRSFVTANVSLPARLFHGLGGFDERFHRWGGEDTELGWRLWSSGATFIDADDLTVEHQVEEDFSGGSEGRRRAHQLNMGLISSLIPHSFYRKEPPTAIPEIPKVSVIVDDVPAGAAEEIWEVLLGQPRTDFEMIVIADIDDQEPLAGASVGDPRLSFVTTMEEATAKARGEYTCFLNGHGAPSRDLLTNVIRRLDKQPMTLTATVGYALPTQDGGSVRSSNGARDIDVAWGREMPHCWFIRTRELRRLAKDQTGVDQVFAATRSWDANLHWPSAALRLPGAARSDRPEGFTHRSMGRQELATDVVTRRRSLTEAAVVYVRTRNRANVNVQPAPSKNETSPGRRSDRDRPTARYIGWSGHHNLGDELMLDSVRLLLPWADIETSGDPGQLLILGGGTLINRSSYLKQVTDRDTPRVERCVIGTGVANPDFWGEQEDPERWVRWLSSCAYVGVRGPLSFERLREWGFTGEMEISGDSALLLERPDVPRIGGRVVIAPAWTKGRLWGGSDDAVMEAMAAAVKEWRSMGREVVALASSPDDDGQILQIVERNDGGTVPFVQGYLDTAAAVELIASADVVVGERLHACVVAAAVGTPFVPVEYRPKLRDFAASVGVEQLVIRSDSISAGGLMERADEAMELPADHVSGQVNRYRDTLRAAGQVVERAVR